MRTVGWKQARLVLAGLLATCIAFAGELPAALLKRLERALANNDEAGLLSLLDELKTLPAAEAVKCVLEIGAEAGSDAVFDRALATLAGYGHEALHAPILELLSQRKLKPMWLAVALAYAQQQKDELSEQWIVQGILHPAELVQRNAIDAAITRRSKAAIDALIEVMAQDGMDAGLIGYNAHMALIQITGADFNNVDDWRQYWAVNRESFNPHEAPSDARTGILRKEVDLAQFFGVEIISRRVVFVIDVSGSMSMYDSGGEAGGSDWRVRERLTRTKRELTNAIEKLDRRGFFNVIAYNSRLFDFVKSLLPANDENKLRAIHFVRKLVADSATHTDEALRRAFEDAAVDTIILLSDGAPMKSRNEGPNELIPRILSDVKRMNRLRKIRIFTLGFEGRGEWPPGSKYARTPPSDPAQMVDFLQRLARENGGSYTSID